MTLRVLNSCDQGGTGDEVLDAALMSRAVANGAVNVGTWTLGRYLQWEWNIGPETRIDLPDTFSGTTFWCGFWHLFDQDNGFSDDVEDWIGVHRGGSAWNNNSNMNDSTYSIFHIASRGFRTNFFIVYDATDTAVAEFHMSIGRWHYIAIEVSAVDAGSITIKVDGETVVDAVSGDFQASATAASGQYSFCMAPQRGSSDERFDDFVFGDGAGSDNTGIPESSMIETILPDGDDTNTGFTTVIPSSPTSRYDKIDDSNDIDDDTSYIESSALSDEYTVTMANLTLTSNTIFGMKTGLVGRRSSGLDTTTLRVRLEISATYYNGGDNVFSDTYDYFADIWEDNPADSLAWEDADIDGLNISGILV